MRSAKTICILLLASCMPPTAARGRASLSARDSAAIALLIADRIAPSLRSANGADSTNAVCVGLEAHGIMMHVLDSALRVATGGAIVAPVSISPLRTIAIDSLIASSDSVWLTWRTSGGGLRKGEMAWGHHTQLRLVRRHQKWTDGESGRGTIGDGYIRADLPKPPNPPDCLPTPAG